LLLLGLLLRPRGDWLRRRGRGGVLAHLLAAFIVENRSHSHIHREALAGMPSVHAANRCDVATIPAVRNTDASEADRLAEQAGCGDFYSQFRYVESKFC
jgi:hypothetical protein